MSLSGQYLEELSRRYKKQVEELQTAFSKTLLIVEEQNKRSHEREQLLYEQNLKLREDLDELTDKIFSWTNILFYVTAFACIQIVVIWLILRMWSRRCYRHHDDSATYSPSSAPGSSPNLRGDSKNTSPKIRRKSTDGSSGHIANLSMKQRRPSEEALYIGGTYQELLIYEDGGIYNASPDAEEYDQFIEAGRRKNGKVRKVKRAISLGGPIGERKKLLQRQDSAPGDFEKLKQRYVNLESGDTTSHGLDQPPVLDEDYEIYVPGTDFAYNEFMPDGPSGQSTPVEVNGIAGDTSTSSLNSSGKSKTKSRRLSSPAFLKSPFSRSSNSKKKPPAVHHETTTGWEWYRQKSSQNKKSKAVEVLVPVVPATNGHNGNVPVVRNSSSDSIRTGSTNTTTSVSTTSDKKQGSFRRILKKVF